MLATILLAVAIATLNSAALPTTSDVKKAEENINIILEDNSKTQTHLFIYEYKDYPFIGGIVRLAFHDCAGGSCDGCVNHNQRANTGLKKYADELDAVYDDPSNNRFGMSRADFYAFASIVAMEMSTSKIKNEAERFNGRSQFKFGRTDCPTSPNTATEDRLPVGAHGLKKTLQYFYDVFQFNNKEIVALLGAHSLGRCHLENSGFEGRWVDDVTQPCDPDEYERLTPQSTLDNQYYKELVIPWKQIKNSVGTFPWHLLHTFSTNDPAYRDSLWQPTILLNSDFCFEWEFEGDLENGGFVNCDTNCVSFPFGNREPFPTIFSDHQVCCNRSVSTENFVKTFADDNEAFIREYTNVYMKMVNRQFGPTEGTLIENLSKKRDYDMDDVKEILEELSGL